MGKCVRKACKESLKSCGFNPGRSLAKRLEEREISYDEILDTAEEAFVKNPSFEEGDVRKKLEEELEDAFKDANLASLILSGLRLEEDGKYGLIPNLPNEVFKSDPVHLLADEIIGMRIANYINGSKGIFEFERIDRNKPGILGKLGPFLDDVIGGLIGGICSRAYERRNQNENS
ncbi:hypothetical protein AKJ52_02095 [candidate division MSBL1 archaeon SCGC-AAA382C18]|uniref:YutG/PgpA domain-containing protein n=1 Tax=candidate division MSBL1 archaeon SCGC-AAA382C18 TaxID=1698281 RepID=A0A133VJE7_9EURY|nr:hypothetical protein AKJ52_02095 [candidate division MSBL1 archaeon SCGC-AAA382C18]